jgi:hypothetical protein
MSKNIIPEKYNRNSPNPISFDQLKTILSQMKKCAKISYNNIRGTAFFLEYTLKDKKSRKVLVTCGHVLEEKILEEKKILTVSLNNISNGENSQISKAIHLGLHRKKLCCTQLDLAFIEIIESDKIPPEYFFEIDENYKDGKENFKNISKNKSIYILNCPEGKDCVVSFGVILETKDSNILYNCNTDQGSSGAPIFSLNNHKVIGIHTAGIKDSETNIGTFLIEGLERFNEHFNSRNNFHKSNCFASNTFDSGRILRHKEINRIKPKEKKNNYIQEENPFRNSTNQINSKSNKIIINNSKNYFAYNGTKELRKSFVEKSNYSRNNNSKYSYSTRASKNNIKYDEKNLHNKFESNNVTPIKKNRLFSIIEFDSTKNKETDSSDNKNNTNEKNAYNEKQIDNRDKNIKKELFTNKSELNTPNKPNNSIQRRNRITHIHVINNMNIKRTDCNNVKVITTIYKKKK